MEIDKPEVIGARLKSLRQALGYKRARAFYNVVGIPATTWSNYECGLRRISIDEAMKVIARTGVSLDWIYRGLDHTLPVQIAEQLRLQAEADRAGHRDWLDLTPAKRG